RRRRVSVWVTQGACLRLRVSRGMCSVPIGEWGGRGRALGDRSDAGSNDRSSILCHGQSHSGRGEMMRGWRRAAHVGVALTGVLGAMIGFTATSAGAAPKATVTTVASGFDN